MARVPTSTYRVQFHKDFTFDDAIAIVDYLRALGISHFYASPYLQAAPGSMHGYDVVDHRRVNEEVGGEEGHERFCSALKDAGLGQVLDIVPNHMSLARQNKYWWDVLENGTNSRYASFFDVDWNSPEERLRDKVLVPILGDQYGRVLKSGDIRIVRMGASFTVMVYDQELPVAPQTLAPLLSRAADYARSDMLNFLAASFARLPQAEFWDRRLILARHRDRNVLLKLLERLCAEEDNVCQAIDRTVKEFNANADDLDAFLAAQNYRLAFWKAADQQLGYRRFFDVNTLIGLRVEREHVFDETHALIIKWLKAGVLDGVRIDHPDGLRDPKQYFERLRSYAPDAWIVGEKILEPGEWMRSEWPIEGTSGYDFLNLMLGTLIDSDGLKKLGEHYSVFTGDTTPFPTVAHDKKIAVGQEALGSDVNRLADIFVRICESNREYRDFTRAECRRVVREVAACFSVYRTYVIPDRKEVIEEDRERIASAIQCAKDNRQDVDASLFDFMRAVLTLEIEGKNESEFVYRFQQYTSPVMAKGVEDTAFYCSNRLTAMNEVGGDPACTGFSLDEFHGYQLEVQRSTPTTMTTLSTHDTKRSDDVRARLVVLSEIPDEFAQAARTWQELTAAYRSPQVDPGTEWFLYQTLVGAWPIDAERLRNYMQKAMREAKQRTSWVNNNAEYENAVAEFIDKLLADAKLVASVENFVNKLQPAGRVNSLSQTLVKCTAPGVPDLYQGGELWDFSLVDPDNRRPVDYKQRQALLQELPKLDVSDVMARIDEGLPKLWVIHHALHLRAKRPESFADEGEYTPLKASGTQAERVLAFVRGGDVITAIPLRNAQSRTWGDTSLTLPEGSWRNLLTDESWRAKVRMEDMFAKFPVALLTQESKA
ncbi:malto-oligosyltrehalose synthase [Granulicella cerasi]|uniref:malto-oligosyltrehalose synthase n=1 Tax=Granulicella cerasi TaxID=741063 RepID=UPI0021DFFE86|nr:malto-oligosyltrehalose synthase [Granulicella cerasi]